MRAFIIRWAAVGGLVLCIAGCTGRAQLEDAVDFETTRPATADGLWRVSWKIEGQFGHTNVACATPGATYVLARVLDDENRSPRRERRFRAPCDAPGKEGFTILEPGKYRVKVELWGSGDKVLATTNEGDLLMPADRHPQSTPVIFQLRDGVVIKAGNQQPSR